MKRNIFKRAILPILLIATLLLTSCSFIKESDIGAETEPLVLETNDGIESETESESTIQPEIPAVTEPEIQAPDVIRPMSEYVGMTVGEIKQIFGTDYEREGYIDMYSQYIIYPNGETPLQFWFYIPIEVPENLAFSCNPDNIKVHAVSYYPDYSTDSYPVTNQLDAYTVLSSLTGGVFDEDVGEYEYCYFIELDNNAYINYSYETYPSAYSVADKVTIGNYNQ